MYFYARRQLLKEKKKESRYPIDSANQEIRGECARVIGEMAEHYKWVPKRGVGLQEILAAFHLSPISEATSVDFKKKVVIWSSDSLLPVLVAMPPYHFHEIVFQQRHSSSSTNSSNWTLVSWEGPKSLIHRC